MLSVEGFKNRKRQRIDELTGIHNQPVVTPYEQNCILFLHDYIENFKAHYPSRRTPFLICCDQYGTQRIICTMIATTMLSQCEMYDVNTCSQFFARFLQHEPLEQSDSTPYYLPSSDCVIRWGISDSFDSAVLLCSALVGFGYEAYVVWGEADARVGQCDASQIMYSSDESEVGNIFDACCSQPKTEAKESANQSNQASPQSSPKLYAMPTKQACTSSYDEEMRSRNKEAASFKLDYYSGSMDVQAHAAFNQQHSLPPQHIPSFDDTESNGKDAVSWTIHAWVYVKSGKRGLTRDLFIESTSGKVYNATDTSTPYHSIEGMWNQRNYWTNVQASIRTSDCNLDLNATWKRSSKEQNFHCWEHVFHDTWDLSNDLSGNELQCPPASFPPIRLSREEYNLRYFPAGRKTIFYHNAKLDLYSPGIHHEGLVKKATVYLDPEHSIVASTNEVFEQRSDHLTHRLSNTLEMKCVDCYSPGLETGLKIWTEWVGNQRSIEFYVDQRVDGLESIDEVYGSYIAIKYRGRHDRLTYRRVDFVTQDADDVALRKSSVDQQRQAMYLLPSSDKVNLQVSKIVVEFESDADSKSIFKTSLRNIEEKQVSKKTFFVEDGKIVSKYHYDKDRITRLEEEEKIGSGRVGVLSDLDKGADMKNASLLSLEREAIASVYLDVVRLSEARKSYKLSLNKTIFDKALSNASVSSDSAVQHASEADQGGESLDYLYPFLRNCKDARNLNREEAQQARDACLQSLKERLVERTNIIQDRLVDENSKLSKRQELFQRNQREGIVDSTVSGDYEKYCSDAMFRIKVLEQRLVTHEELAIKKFADLESKLSKDGRLASLQYLS